MSDRRALTIPRHELKLSFARSSGPGGQNVNKLNTKVTLRWSVVDSPSISDEVRQRFLARYRRKMNDVGEVVLVSQSHRQQGRNVADCIAKLHALLQAVATPPRKRKKTAVPKRSREKRLREKREQSQRKQSRRRPGAGDD